MRKFKDGIPKAEWAPFYLAPSYCNPRYVNINENQDNIYTDVS